MKISIGNDRSRIQKAIVKMLEARGYEVTNYGTDTFDSVRYPDFAHPVATDVEENDFGIVICGSGNGIAMTVNKHARY
jgi:ribose 5-phosphate isomerase B